MTRRLSVLVAFCLMLALWPVMQSAVAADEIGQGVDHAPYRALVGAKVGGRSAARNAIESHGGRVLSYYEPGDFFVVETPSRAPDWVRSMQGNRSVRYAELDHVLTADATPTDPRYGELWAMPKIEVPAAWDSHTGFKGVVVGVIDTGVDYTHEDLATQMWTNPGEIAGNGVDDDGNGRSDDVYGNDCKNNDGNPMDDNNHGTHVAGTIGAAANNGKGVAGVTWNVSIMALKFLGSNGSGYTSDAVECLDYAVAEGAHLTSNSWGGGGFNQALYDAINRARAANQLFMAAAGNSSVDTDKSPHYPSSYGLDNIVSVAATDRNDALASFSNYGATSVDLAAPGVSILSTVRGNSYSNYNGTSMATPHVAGAAALLLSADPTLASSYAQLRDLILNNVDPIAALSGKTVTGGRLDVYSALLATGTIDARPSVTLALPEGQIVAGSVALEATVTDDVGVTGVEFFDGPTSLGAGTFDTVTGRWSLAWDTTAASDGAHTIMSVATDTASQTGSDASTVTVDNVPDPVPTATHIHGMAGSSSSSSRYWSARVTLSLHDDLGNPVAGAVVTVAWSRGSSATSTCTTSSTGACTATSGSLLKKSDASVIATVTGVDSSPAYRPDANHSGNSITIVKP